MSANRNYDYSFFYRRRQDLINSRNQYLNNINGQKIIYNPQLSNWNASKQETFVDGAQTMVFRGSFGNGEVVSVGGIVNIPPYEETTDLNDIITIPSAPSITSIVAGNQQLTVNFTIPLSDGGLPINNYEFSINNGSSWSLANIITSPIIITGLSNGTTYNVQIRAINPVGAGMISSMVQGTPVTIPSAPTINSITEGNQTLTVNFTAPSSNGGTPITSYQYSINNGASFLSTGSIVSPILISSGLTNGETYQVILRAFNVVGGSANSGIVLGTPGSVPMAPEDVYTPNTQLLLNPEFTNITNNAADNWHSTQGWQAWAFSSGSRPTAVMDMPTRDVYPISNSTGFVIFSFNEATISQTISIDNLVGINTITGVLNIANVSNGRADTFTFLIEYKSSTGSNLYTNSTGSISAPASWTDYTLTLTRAASPNFDLIKSIKVSIVGDDIGFWAGQYGPAMDYCRLTVS
jgi:hypothetical protein